MLRTRLFILIFLSFSSKAWGASSSTKGGGDEIGNGGHVVFCSGATPSYQALDAYEAVLRGFKIELAPTTGDIFQDAIGIVSRLDSIDSERAARYRDNIAFIKSTHRFVSDMQLPRTNDANSYPIPNNCELTQAIVQLREPVEGNSFFLVNRRIWNTLDDTHKTIMIVHEAIYWDSIRYYGQTDAAGTRNLNAVILSNRLRNMTQEDYVRFLESLRLNIAPWRDDQSKMLFAISKEATSSVREDQEFCRRLGMMLLDRDIAFSEAFENFLSSPVAKYHFSWRRQFLRLNEPHALLITASSESSNPVLSNF